VLPRGSNRGGGAASECCKIKALAELSNRAEVYKQAGPPVSEIRRQLDFLVTNAAFPQNNHIRMLNFYEALWGALALIIVTILWTSFGARCLRVRRRTVLHRAVLANLNRQSNRT
jgi:hypothetical protein